VWALGTNHVSVNCFFFFLKKKNRLEGSRSVSVERQSEFFFPYALENGF
jgi:hypothetical protein